MTLGLFASPKNGPAAGNWSRAPRPSAGVVLILSASTQPTSQVGEVVCRPDGTWRAVVNHHSCKEVEDYHEISIDYWFAINPLLEDDWSNIVHNTDYCISGCTSSSDRRAGAPRGQQGAAHNFGRS